MKKTVKRVAAVMKSCSCDDGILGMHQYDGMYGKAVIRRV